jgi:Ni/Co efflux regulator RcnB
VPGRGYVRAPPIYQRHYWPPGDILPEWYWRYEIADYGRYGLPMPPDGCRWVWVDDDVALIDADGFILDVVRNVW